MPEEKVTRSVTLFAAEVVPRVEARLRGTPTTRPALAGG